MIFRLQRSLISKDALIKDLKNKIDLLEEKEKKSNEIINTINRKEKSKSKESWKIDFKYHQNIDMKNKSKSGIKGSRIPTFGSSSNIRNKTPLRGSSSPSSQFLNNSTQSRGQGHGEEDEEGEGEGEGDPITLSNDMLDKDIQKFDKDVAEAEFLSATAHLSTAELRNR